MTSGFFQALGAILAVLLILGTAVGTWAALRTGKQSQVIKNYRDAATSWRERSEAQEAETKLLREELAESQRKLEEYQTKSESRIAELETQLNVLQGIVTARDEFNYLKDQVRGLREDTLEILSLIKTKAGE